MADGDGPVRFGREGSGRAPSAPRGVGGVASVTKSLRILEVVAERGGATARELSEILAVPLPSVYRLANNLVTSEYLVHMAAGGHYELGYKLHALGVSLHRQLAVPAPIRLAVDSLHRDVGAAAYFALYRGVDVVVAYVSDCAEHPRIRPLDFGFHEAGHATAFGKILLAGMDAATRGRYLRAHPLTRFTPATITTRRSLDRALDEVATLGLATENEEFVPGQMCAAAPVRDVTGAVVGSIAISSATRRTSRYTAATQHLLRVCAAQASGYYRGGALPGASRRHAG